MILKRKLLNEKYTITCNIAVNAVLDGKKTLIIEVDPQGYS